MSCYLTDEAERIPNGAKGEIGEAIHLTESQTLTSINRTGLSRLRGTLKSNTVIPDVSRYLAPSLNIRSASLESNPDGGGADYE